MSHPPHSTRSCHTFSTPQLCHIHPTRSCHTFSTNDKWDPHRKHNNSAIISLSQHCITVIFGPKNWLENHFTIKSSDWTTVNHHRSPIKTAQWTGNISLCSLPSHNITHASTKSGTSQAKPRHSLQGIKLTHYIQISYHITVTEWITEKQHKFQFSKIQECRVPPFWNIKLILTKFDKPTQILTKKTATVTKNGSYKHSKWLACRHIKRLILDHIWQQITHWPISV